MLVENIEFRNWTDHEQYHKVLSEVMDQNKDCRAMLELVLAACERQWQKCLDLMDDSRHNWHHYGLQELDKVAAQINFMAGYFPNGLFSVELGRRNSANVIDDEAQAMLVTARKILKFIGNVVHKLQEPIAGDRACQKYFLQYAVYLCEQVQRMIGVANGHNFDHPDSLHWLNILERVQRRMANFWVEAAKETAECAAKKRTLRAGIDMTVTHLGPSGEILDVQAINLVPGHQPVFKLNPSEKLHFDVPSGWTEPQASKDAPPQETQYDFTLELRPGYEQGERDYKAIALTTGWLYLNLYHGRDEGNYFVTAGR